MNLSEIMEMIISISNNIFLLISIVFFYALSNFEIQKESLFKKCLAGIIIGLAALFIMSTPLEFIDGVVFDSRTILFVVSGAYFGFIPTVIAAVFAISYRILLGGSGMFVGISTIIISGLAGIIWQHVFGKYKIKQTRRTYYLLGLVSHLCVTGLLLILPNNIEILLFLIMMYLVIFPLTIMFISIVIKHQQDRIMTTKLDQLHKSLLQSSIDASSNTEIYAVDTKYKYLTFNIFHQGQIKKYYQTHIEVGDNLLDAFDNLEQKQRIKKFIDMALSGQTHTPLVKVYLDGEKTFEEHFSPITRGKDIVGVSIFIKDVTEQKKYEESIIRLSYYDTLTNLPNRRFFQDKIAELNNTDVCPLSIITCDINGLKLFNDALGQRMGDQVLIKVGKVLESHLDFNGYLCRVGGDEFVYLLPNTDFKTATKFLDVLEKNTDKLYFKGIRISITFGLAVQHEGDVLDDVLKLSEEEMHKNKLFEIASHRSEFIKSILNTLQEKNSMTKEHSIRVASICTEIGKKLHMKKHELNLLEAIASLHDIGKIAIDEAILNKPGKLTEEEWNIIKQHPEIGYRIISTAPEYAGIAEDILSHHERYDGKGYPRGIKGDNIPIRARIVSIADAYDAMVFKRTYREPLSHDEAIAEIIRCKGTQFDPKLVDIFLELLDNNILNLD